MSKALIRVILSFDVEVDPSLDLTCLHDCDDLTTDHLADALFDQFDNDPQGNIKKYILDQEDALDKAGIETAFIEWVTDHPIGPSSDDEGMGAHLGE